MDFAREFLVFQETVYGCDADVRLLLRLSRELVCCEERIEMVQGFCQRAFLPCVAFHLFLLIMNFNKILMPVLRLLPPVSHTEKGSIVIGVGVILVLAAIAGILISPGAVVPAHSGKLKVVASFYPLFDFARNVGGDRVTVSVLIPPGVEPHDYEFSPSDAREVSNADAFLYNGAGLEPWVPQLLDGIGNPNLSEIDTSAGVSLVSSQDPDQPGSDPHVWLDPVLAKKQVEAIRDAFIRKDPSGKATYESNAAAYLSKLDALDAAFRAGLAHCQKRDIFITHATLAYFCREYKCTQYPIEGVNAEAEPLPADLAAFINKAKADNVTTVFVEPQFDSRAAQTIASEINGTIAVFNSVHGLTAQQQAAGAGYISLMNENVQTLKNALGCD